MLSPKAQEGLQRIIAAEVRQIVTKTLEDTPAIVSPQKSLDLIIESRIAKQLKSDFIMDAIKDATEEVVEDQLDKKLDAALDEKLGSIVEEKCEDLVDDKLDTIVSNKLDDVVGEKIDASVDAQLEKTVKDQVERQIGDEIDSRIDKAVDNSLEGHDWGAAIKEAFDVEEMIEDNVKSHRTTEIIQQAVGQEIGRSTCTGEIREAIQEEMSVKMKDVSENAAALAIRMAAEARVQAIGQDDIKAMVSSNITNILTDAVNSVLEAEQAPETTK